jgi:Flp pilus assembly pilin Flp
VTHYRPGAECSGYIILILRMKGKQADNECCHIAVTGERRNDMYHLKKCGNKSFLSDERGMGTVEIILIIVVLIGLVIIFKEQLTALVKNVFQTITNDSNTVMS